MPKTSHSAFLPVCPATAPTWNPKTGTASELFHTRDHVGSQAASSTRPPPPNLSRRSSEPSGPEVSGSSNHSSSQQSTGSTTHEPQQLATSCTTGGKRRTMQLRTHLQLATTIFTLIFSLARPLQAAPQGMPPTSSSSSPSSPPIAPPTSQGAHCYIFDEPSPPSPTPSQPSQPPIAARCIPGTLRCSFHTAFSMCAPSAPGADGFVEMGAVPAGMECVDDGGQGNQGGRLIRMPGVQGRCEGGEEGGLRCEEGGRAWWTCAGGVWEGMGALAEGTGCVEGKIVGL